MKCRCGLSRKFCEFVAKFEVFMDEKWCLTLGDLKQILKKNLNAKIVEFSEKV